MREKCVLFQDLDLIGIAETHLLNESTLDLPGFVWYGHNRTNIHVKAKRDSDGVGFFIKHNILNAYTVSVVDNSFEGVLWLEFVSKTHRENFMACVCYLPPIEPSRNIDGNEFYVTLLCQIHMYCQNSVFFVCGDLNSRCSDLEDHFSCVDEVGEREVVDFTLNKYGEYLCDFLIDSNCCILNGRKSVSNNYTFVGPNGNSVVVYCLVPYELLSSFSDFKVTVASELLSLADIADSV